MNTEQLRFNWLIGHDIVEMKVEKSIHPQLGGETNSDTDNTIHPQLEGELQKPDSQYKIDIIFNIPWGHHKLILDRAKGDVKKALFFVNQTVENGWSRAMLLN